MNPEIDMGGYSYPTPEEGLTRWTLDPGDVIQMLELQMLGLKVSGNEIVKFRENQMMNKDGISRIIMILDSHINKNNVLGHIMREEAYKLVKKVAIECNKLMFINRKRWGLSREDWQLLNLIIPNQVFMFLTRPIDGRERRRLSESFVVRENASPAGGLQQLNPFKTKEVNQDGNTGID